MRTTSAGLLLLLAGVVLLAALVSGAVPRLLETLFSPTPGAAGAATGLVPSGNVRPQPLIGASGVA